MNCTCITVDNAIMMWDSACPKHAIGSASEEPIAVRPLTRSTIERLWLKSKTDAMRNFYMDRNGGQNLDTRDCYKAFAWDIERYIKGEDV
jgi:hypothetical protein